MIVECTRGFATVKNPLTDEPIDVSEPFETDEDTFAALQDRYAGFVVVEPDDEDTNPGSEAGKAGGTDADDAQDAEGDSPEEEICGTEMTDGSVCERPAGECGYHD